jgi:hypothetical protein
MTTDRQTDFAARGLAEQRRRAAQQSHTSNKRWAALDAQAVGLQQQLAAAEASGDTRQARYARKALANVVRGMGRLLSEQQMLDPTQPQPNGDPWTRR